MGAKIAVRVAVTSDSASSNPHQNPGGQLSDLIREGRRVLVFSAHAADYCSRAGGTIARLVEAGGLDLKTQAGAVKQLPAHAALTGQDKHHHVSA